VKLAYFPGSPFARICRVLILEWSLPVEPVEQTFPTGTEMFPFNPFGQVPALLRDDGTSLFPTFLILEELWQMAGGPAEAYGPGDRQPLLVALQATDVHASMSYQKWTGLRPQAHNAIGFDLAERQRARVHTVLAWFERQAEAGVLRPGVTLPGVALACLCLWSDARERLDWRHPHLARLVNDLAARDSFAQTGPQPWSYPWS
jgi:glutathione S-transferase